MPEEPSLIAIRETLLGVVSDATRYFDDSKNSIPELLGHSINWSEKRDFYWEQLPETLQKEAHSLIRRLMLFSGQLASILKSALLVSEADQRDLAMATKTMRAALLFRNFQHQDTEILHDEDIVLGVKPPHQSDNYPLHPQQAKRIFLEWGERVIDILQLVESSGTFHSSASTSPIGAGASRYRPGTAFIMMWMSKAKPELDDVSDAVKEIFSAFDIRAIRADDIEHEDLITKRILDEISTAEFLFADLTGARPSVYYEVGYAHALGKRVILFRKAGTGIHFDLSGYNCPEYDNLRELKEKLTKRLESLTNKNPKEKSKKLD